MSFDTNLSLYNLWTGANPCVTCFDAGETPEQIFMSLQGVMIGDTWAAPDEPPPNGVWQLDYDGSCQWSDREANLTVLYKKAFPGSSLVISLPIGGFVFSGPGQPVCTNQFSNFYVAPAGRNYWGGSAVFLNPLESGTLNNPELMALVGMEPGSGTFCSMNRPDVDHITNRYSRREDATNIHIKYDLT